MTESRVLTRSLKRRWLPIMALLALLLISASCALGSSRGAAEPTPTKTPRPTFTPLSGAGGAQPGSSSGVFGQQPPGVTVAAPGVSADAQTPQVGGEGSTNLVLFATETPPPAPTELQRTPFAFGSPTVDVETNRPTLEAGARAESTPYVVVEAKTLNGRRGPGESYGKVGEAAAGDELWIMARTTDGEWWQVCCLANQPVWISAAEVAARGAVEAVPAVTPVPTTPPTPRPPPAPKPPPTNTPPPQPTPLPPFDVAKGPEFPSQRDDGRMTIWARVYEGQEPYTKALPGYVLKVTRDGVDVSLPDQSYEPFDNTGPQQGNYIYNLKFEMYDASEADWEIYLAKPDGTRMSLVTKFTTKGDSYRNLVVYIAYLRVR